MESSDLVSQLLHAATDPGQIPFATSGEHMRLFRDAALTIRELCREVDALKRQVAANTPVREGGTATAKCGGFVI